MYWPHEGKPQQAATALVKIGYVRNSLQPSTAATRRDHATRAAASRLNEFAWKSFRSLAIQYIYIYIYEIAVVVGLLVFL